MHVKEVKEVLRFFLKKPQKTKQQQTCQKFLENYQTKEVAMHHDNITPIQWKLLKKNTFDSYNEFRSNLEDS